MKSAAKPGSAKPVAEVTSIRWNDGDRRLLALLQKKLGVSSASEIARMGLRALAAKEGVK